MPFLNIRRGEDLTRAFLSDIVLQVPSFVAENERTNIRQRQVEGIAAVKIRGIRFGRPPSPLPECASITHTGVENLARSPEQWQPENVRCHYQASGIGRRFTK